MAVKRTEHTFATTWTDGKGSYYLEFHPKRLKTVKGNPPFFISENFYTREQLAALREAIEDALDWQKEKGLINERTDD